MTKLVHSIGAIGLLLLFIGASLYAINSPHQPLTRGALTAGAFILLVYAALNLDTLRDFFKKRSSRYGANMVAMIILFTTILVVIQALSMRHSYRFDLTSNKRFSLAEQTLGVLGALQTDVTISAFYQNGAPERIAAGDLLDQFAHKSPHLRYEFIDPDQRPQMAKDMKITSYGTSVVRCNGRSAVVTRLNEENLLNAVVKVTRDDVKTIYFVFGHGEKDVLDTDPGGYAVAKSALESDNHEVRRVSLFDVQAVPEDCDLLVVAGPKKDYFDAEVDKIAVYLAGGHHAFFLVDPQVDLPNLADLLIRYRIELGNDVIVDPFSRVKGGDYTIPVVSEYENHLITWDFSVATFFPLARSIHITDANTNGVISVYLAKAGKKAWGETNLDGMKNGQAIRQDDDVQAPVPLAAISIKRYENGVANAEGPDMSQIAVIGDSDFAANSSFRVSGNGDLFLNIVNFLAGEKDRISVRPKEALGDRLFLTESQGRFIFLVSVVLLPLAVIGLGTGVWFRKRKMG